MKFVRKVIIFTVLLNYRDIFYLFVSLFLNAALYLKNWDNDVLVGPIVISVLSHRYPRDAGMPLEYPDHIFPLVNILSSCRSIDVDLPM